MSFILILVLVVVFFYLNSRISTLESLVRSHYGGNFVPKPTTPGDVPVVPTPQAVPQPPREGREESSGKWLGKIGIAAVSFGFLFLLQYAYEQGWVSEWGLVGIGVFCGLALGGLGAYLRSKYERYGNLLIGGGISLLFISDYVSSSVYHLVSNGVALFVALVITALAVAVALAYRSQVLMGAGVGGAILSVFILGISKDLVAFTFTYMAILAAGVLAVSFVQKWLKIHYVTFIATYVVYFIMSVSWFKAGQNTTMFAFFLTIFFLIYLVSSILHHFVRGEDSSTADIGLVVANAIASFFFYSYLLIDTGVNGGTEVVAYIAFGYAVIYGLLAYLAHQYYQNKVALENSFTALSALFLIWYIPLLWDGRVVTVVWLLVAVGFFLATLKIKTQALRFFGPLTITLALIRYFLIDGFKGDALLNPALGVGILSIGVCYIASWISHRWTYEQAVDRRNVAAVFFVLAHFLTMFVGTREINRHYDISIRNVITAEREIVDDYGGRNVESLENERNAVVSVAWTLYAVLLLIIGFGFKLAPFRTIGLIIFFITAIKVFFDVWSLGQLYRIISSIVYGVVALVGSFLYSKYYSHKPTHHS